MTAIGTSRHTARHTIRSPKIGGRVTPAADYPQLTLAPWARQLGSPVAESNGSRRMAHLGGLAAGVDVDAEGLDATTEHGAAAIVDLHGHEPWRELHDVRLESERAQRVGRFEPEETSADHRAVAAADGEVGDGFEIVDRAVDEAPFGVVARDGRHERRRAGREHQRVVHHGSAHGRGDRARVAVDANGRVPDVYPHAGDLQQRRIDLQHRRVGLGLERLPYRAHRIQEGWRMLGEGLQDRSRSEAEHA